MVAAPGRGVHDQDHARLARRGRQPADRDSASAPSDIDIEFR
jgi:hypothetical protein